MVAPALQTEGKQLQREQHIGMAAAGAGRSRLSPTDVESRGHGSGIVADQPIEELALERAVAHDEVLVLDYGGQYSQLIAWAAFASAACSASCCRTTSASTRSAVAARRA